MPEEHPPGGQTFVCRGEAGCVESSVSASKSGDLIEGTGGVRKLRWVGGRGKSGGVRRYPLTTIAS